MPLPPAPRTLDDLLDRAAIADVVFAYATGVDRRDWALYRSIFLDEVDFDFTTWAGMRETIAADLWVDTVKGTLSPFDATSHVFTNLVTLVAKDEATCTVTMSARHVLGAEQQTVGGYYIHRLRRTPDGWRIAACKLTITHETGGRALFDHARARGPRARIDVGEQGI